MRKRQQYAALPFRRTHSGLFEIGLLTSRGTGRWVIPKGWPISGLEPWDSAAQEALEEGGFIGEVLRSSIGSFEYQKRTSHGPTQCVVAVYALCVKTELIDFPEKGQRETGWFLPIDAARQVNEPDLASLILRVPALVP